MNNNNKRERLFDNLPPNQTTLEETVAIQDRARKAGFDWEKRQDVWKKVKEELAELEVEVEKCDAEKMEEEFGDFLFSMINAARLYNINPEKALKYCNNKFRNRFGHIEDRAFESGKRISEMSLEEMASYWNEAKAIERGLKIDNIKK